MPAALFDVLRKHMHAAHEIVGIRCQGLAQELGIGENEIGWRQRIGDLAYVKFGLLLGMRTEIGGIRDELVGPLRSQKVGLFEKIEELVLRPFRIAEPLVSPS